MIANRIVAVIVLILSYLVTSMSSHAHDFLRWRFLTSENGLAESWVSSITISSNGDIYTNHGDIFQYSVYDGFSIQIKKSPVSTERIYKDQQDQLWTVIPGEKGGIANFNQGGWQISPIQQNLQKYLGTRIPYLPWEKGLLLLSPDMLLQTNLQQDDVLFVKPLEDTSLGRFNDIKLVDQSTLWIAGDNGLLKYDQTNWEEYLIPPSLNIAQLSNLSVNQNGEVLMMGKDRNTGKGDAIRFKNLEWERLNVEIDGLFGVSFGNDNDIWYLSRMPEYNQIHHSFDGILQLLGEHKILSSRITDYAADPEGKFWLTTTAGLAYYCPPPWKPLSQWPEKKPANLLYENEQKRLWIRTSDSLNIYDKGEITCIPFGDFTNQYSHLSGDIIRINETTYYIGNHQGKLIQFNPLTNSLTLSSLPTKRLIDKYYKSKSGTIYYLTYDEATQKHQLASLTSDGVFTEYDDTIDFDKTGNFTSMIDTKKFGLLIAGNKSITVIRRDAAIQKLVSTYPGRGAFSLLELDDGRVWCGERDCILEYDGSEWKYIRKTGLETVRSMIQAEDGSIWVGSGNGLHHYWKGSWIKHDIYDGLPDTSISTVFQDSSNTIWVGTNLGIYYLDREVDRDAPDTFIAPHSNPQKILVNTDSFISFSGKDKWNYTLPDHLKYAYRFDQQPWSEFRSETKASSLHLGPGKHTIQVKSIDRCMNIDPTPALFSFTINNPWYKEIKALTMFVIGLVLLFISSSYAIHRHLMLHHLVDQRTIELSDANNELKEEIATRHEIETKLRRLRNYLSNTIDSMPSLIIGVDVSGKVTLWNKRAEQVTGINAETAHNKILVEVFPEMAVEMEKIRESIRSGEIKQDQKKQRQTDKGLCYENITIYPLVAEGIESAVVRIDDVTEKVRMEEMMIQSEKMLSVGGLAAGMAHEINNPLAGMMQTADVMKNRLTNIELPANQRAADKLGMTMENIHAFMEERGVPSMLNIIIESGKRAAKIVSNMLSFAQKSDSAFSTYNLAELLDYTVDLASSDYNLKQKFDFRQIEIIREYEKDIPLAPCESSNIQQVFFNILRNGAEAMQENKERDGAKPARFILRLAHEREAGMIRIEIEDNGYGMDEDTRKRVFEPFFTTKPTDQGTGLGLSVSYFIITENHNGTMTVESTTGEGTKFIIRLPLER